VLILLLVGCGSGQKLTGGWEGYGIEENVEFIDSDTVNWDGVEFEYEIVDGKLRLGPEDSILKYDYSIENGKLFLKDGSTIMATYIKEDFVKSNDTEMKKLSGEWGELAPLFIFTENGEMIIGSLPETNKTDEGKYVASDGIIKYISNSGLAYNLYLEYEFENDELHINYIDEEAIQLIRVDSEDMRKKAADDYKQRFEAGMLGQGEFDELNMKESKAYINDKLIRYVFKEIDGPDNENSGAVDVEIDIRNLSSRTIKYVGFKVFFKNAVGDVLDSAIGSFSEDNSFNLELTGPIKSGETSMSGSYWSSVIFNSGVSEWEIAELKIDYMDGEVINIKGEKCELIRLEGSDSHNSNSEDEVGTEKDGVSHNTIGDDKGLSVYVDGIGLEVSELIELQGEPSEIFDYQGSIAYRYEQDMIVYFIVEVGEKEIVTSLSYYGNKPLLKINKGMTRDEVVKTIVL